MSNNLELFKSEPPSPRAKGSPLAARLRPSTWEAFQGLASLDQNIVRQLSEGRGVPPSLILWGPPGTGKTTLAKLVGQSYDVEFVELSAVLGGVKEVREVVDRAKRSSKRTLLFVDEIHRFNKAQQDAFLPHIENGTIIFIGATTENPSFYLTGALLSRVQVLVFPSLGEEALHGILERALVELSLKVEKKGKEIFVSSSGGDARRLLTLLESLIGSRSKKSGQEISAKEIEDYVRDSFDRYYDRSGEEHYNLASAFIKSMRGSDPDAALYWGFRMLHGGEDPRFLIRRMIIFASEDISNADPRALSVAVATGEAYDRIGLPEGRIPIAQCITYLATAPKSNRSYAAMHAVLADVDDNPRSQVPLHLRNAPTKLMKDLGYHEGYDYPHSHEGGFAEGVQYLPDDLAGKKYYDPSDRGYEKNIRERMQQLRGK